jgi:hypothetical protein
MKKNLIKLLCVFTILFAASFSASAQVYVKIRPSIPVIVRPQQPSPRHVWIDEEWEPNGDNYRYAGGHWAAPPHPGLRWKGGHWRRHNEDGEQWVRGGWRRRW